MRCCILRVNDAVLYERAQAPESGVQASDAPSTQSFFWILKLVLVINFLHSYDYPSGSYQI